MDHDDEVVDGESVADCIGQVAGEALTYEIIGEAQKVHRCLGPGFKEVTYHKAMERELMLRGIPFESKRSFQVVYKDALCGTYEPDLLVGGEVIVELKAASSLTPVDVMQTVSYLRATGLSTAQLLNFGAVSLEVRRLKN